MPFKCGSSVLHSDHWGPGGSNGEESACSTGNLASIPGWEDPLEVGMAAPLQCSCLEDSTDHGQRSLGCCSPRGLKESDIDE